MVTSLFGDFVFLGSLFFLGGGGGFLVLGGEESVALRETRDFLWFLLEAEECNTFREDSSTLRGESDVDTTAQMARTVKNNITRDCMLMLKR